MNPIRPQHLNHGRFFYDNAVTPPPLSDKNADQKDTLTDKRYTRLVVDSFSRDTSLFQNPNRYDIQLNEEISDVISVELINIVLPLMKPPTITGDINQFTLLVNNQPFQVVVPVSNYQMVDLASAITNAISATNNSVTAEYNVNTGLFIFTSSQPFSFNFSNCNLGYLLGFPQKQFDASNIGGTYTLTAPSIANPCYLDYTVMYLDCFDANKSNTPILDRSFAILGLDDRSSFNSGKPPIKYPKPAIGKLEKLRISFYDKFGNLYPFNLSDHRFELMITSSKQRLKYLN